MGKTPTHHTTLAEPGHGADAEECAFLAREARGLQSQTLREVAERSTRAAAAYPLLAVLVFLGTDLPSRASVLCFFTGLLTCVTAYARLRILHRVPGWLEAIPRRVPTRILASTLAASVVWGSFAGAVVALDGISFAALVVLTAAAGVLAGGTTTLGIWPRLHRLFVASVLVPLVAGACTLPVGQGIPLGLMFLLYGAMLVVEGARAARSFRGRIESEFLLRRARDAALEANEAKSLFLANMSHEIRTPMNGILGMTEIVLEGELAQEQRQHLSLVRSSAETLLTVINGVLDFSKAEAGQMHLDPAPFSLRGRLAETLKSLGVRASEKGLDLVLDVAPDVPDALIGDAVRLNQIVVNLVGNAVKFTHEGHVAVRVRLSGRSTERATLEIEVADTGIGIPADKQEAIFEAFTQADISMTRDYGGTGLGLSIVNQLAALMHGRVRVESEPDSGSRFFVQVELEVDGHGSLEAPALAPGVRRRARLLIAEPAHASRQVLLERCQALRLAAVTVTDTEELLEVAIAAREQGKPFTHALVDVTLLSPVFSVASLQAVLAAQEGMSAQLMLMRLGAVRREDRRREASSGLDVSNDVPALAKPLVEGDLVHWLGAMEADTASNRDDGKGASGEGSAEPQALDTLEGKRLLLAEDNPVNVLVARKTLERLGCVVTHAANGRLAVEAYEAAAFDLILMDIQMPEMNGYEATAAIRALQQGSAHRTPIVALTAHAMEGDGQRCLDAGMDGYATKPIRKDVLEAELRRVLGLRVAEAA